MAAEEVAKRFAPGALCLECAQQTLDRCRYFACRAAVADGARNRRVPTDRAPDAEVVSVDELIAGAHLLPLDADVGDPMLAATVRATSDVDLELFAVLGKPLVKLLHKPPREALRLRDGQLAELHAGAGDRAAKKWRSFGPQAGVVQLSRHGLRVLLRHVRHEQVLHDRRAQLARPEAFGDIRSRAQLLREDPPPQHGRPNIGVACLLLEMNADVVAVDIVGRKLGYAALEVEWQPPLNRFQRALRRPTVLQEEILETRSLAVLSQDIRIAKHLRHRAKHRHDLIPSDEGVEPPGEVRLRRQASTQPEREPNLAVKATDRGQSDVVDLRVGAPDAASGDGDLEFSRQVVDLWIADKGSSGVECERRGVAGLVGVEAGHGAARNGARVIATRATSGRA